MDLLPGACVPFCASSDLAIITTEITTVLNFLVIFLIKKNHFTWKEFLLRKSPAVVQRTTKHEKNSITFFFEAPVKPLSVIVLRYRQLLYNTCIKER